MLLLMNVKIQQLGAEFDNFIFSEHLIQFHKEL